MPFLRYWRSVFALAWKRAWAVAIGRSLTDIIRDSVVTVLALGSAWLLLSQLEHLGILPEGDSMVADTVVWLLLGICLVVALFGLLLLAEALLLTPYVMWRHQKDRADANLPENDPHLDLKEREVAAIEQANRLRERDAAQRAFEASSAGAVARAFRAKEEAAAMGLRKDPNPRWRKLLDLLFWLPISSDFAGLPNVHPAQYFEALLCDGWVDLPPRHEEMTFDPASPRLRDLLGHDLILARVVWEESRFAWGWALRENPPNQPVLFGLRPRPWEVEELLRSYGNLSEQTLRIILMKASFVWSVLQTPLQPLQDAGRIQLWGRPSSPTADLRRITPDVWRNYRMVDWEAGRAQAVNGESMFTVFAEVLPPRPSPLADALRDYEPPR